MSDERAADRRDYAPFLDAIEALRTDVREDIGHLRDDVREDLAASEDRVMTAMTEYTIRHGAEHAQGVAEAAETHARFEAFIRSAELAQARRDGALGVFRFVLETASRNSRPLIAIVISVAFAAASIAGAIQVQIGFR